MKNYAAYELNTGAIRQVFNAFDQDEALFALSTWDNGDILMGIAEVGESISGMTHYILDDEFAIAFPEKPGDNYVWSFTDHVWYDPRTLAELRAAKTAQIVEWRLIAERGGFDWNGQWIDTGNHEGIDFQAKLVAVITNARVEEAARKPLFNPDGTPQLENNGTQKYSVVYTNVIIPLINNGWVALFQPLILNLGLRYDDFMTRTYQRARNLQALVNSTTDIPTLNALVWTSVPNPPSTL